MSQAQLKKATEIAEAWQLGKDINGYWHVINPESQPKQPISFCLKALYDCFRAMDKAQADLHGKPICTCMDCANVTLKYTMQKLKEA
jgi:hypothetical protein